jgi:hypothetical protein
VINQVVAKRSSFSLWARSTTPLVPPLLTNTSTRHHAVQDGVQGCDV